MLTRDEPLARVLTRLRAELNEVFEARAAAPSLKGARPVDRAELLAQLAEVGRALLAKAGRGDGRDDELVRALFRQLLVVQRDLGGVVTHRDAVFAAWVSVAHAAPALLAESPLAVLGSVANAVMTLARGYPGLVAPWTARLAELAPKCRSVESLRDLGTLIAWRLGFVAVRGAAVRALPALPAELAAPVFGAGGEAKAWSAVAARLAKDRWYDPRDAAEAPRLALVASLGGFAGLGGVFVEPPMIARLGDNLIAFDRERAVLLIADRFGQACVSMTRSDALGVGGDARAYVKKDGTVTFGSLRFRDPRLTEALSAAATDDVLAVSVAHSLKVHLIARLGSGA
jgi:hypothetical protein